MALGRLFSALPVRHGEAADQVEVYLIALEDVTFYALDAVVKMAISGRHPKLSRKFAPTTAELGEAIHDEMETVERQIEAVAERMRLADHRPVVVTRPPFDERAADLRRQMAEESRNLGMSFKSHDDFVRHRRVAWDIIRKGGVYHAILGELYGPPGWVPPVETPAPPPPEPDVLEVEPERIPEPATVDW